MRFMFITTAGDPLVEALRALGHDIDLVTAQPVVDGETSALDATAVLGLARVADAVLHGDPDQGDWRVELPGILTSALSAEQVVAHVSAGDPDVGRAAIVRSFGPRLAAWGIPSSSPILADLAAALTLFED